MNDGPCSNSDRSSDVDVSFVDITNERTDRILTIAATAGHNRELFELLSPRQQAALDMLLEAFPGAEICQIRPAGRYADGESTWPNGFVCLLHRFPDRLRPESIYFDWDPATERWVRDIDMPSATALWVEDLLREMQG